tara:strand:- start:267 stop:500 length:234 start_codon:yes stop_codon:yes gene_type:complete
MKDLMTLGLNSYQPMDVFKMNQLDTLSEVLEDFCTKHNLELHSADDILYGSSDSQLTDYQKNWLSNYIDIWDTIANL